MDIMKELEKYAPHITIVTSVAIPAALTALYYLAPKPLLAGEIRFEEEKVLSPEATRFCTSRLGCGKAILVIPYLRFTPIVAGTHTIVWSFHSTLAGAFIGGDYSMTQSHSVPSGQEGVSREVRLNDVRSKPEYGYAIYWEGLAGFGDGVERDAIVDASAELTDPAGNKVSATGRWSDKMRIYALTASIRFEEAKV